MKVSMKGPRKEGFLSKVPGPYSAESADTGMRFEEIPSCDSLMRLDITAIRLQFESLANPLFMIRDVLSKLVYACCPMKDQEKPVDEKALVDLKTYTSVVQGLHSLVDEMQRPQGKK